MSTSVDSIPVVAAANSDEVLGANLLSSGLKNVVAQREFTSASHAYNDALRHLSDPVVVFAHQDVYLPPAWMGRLARSIAWLEARREAWGVLGVWGVTSDRRFAGRAWCTGGDREHAGPCDEPVPVTAVDEIVIVLNNSVGLRFDDDLPGFHLYGTDIILSAKQKGLSAFAIDAPVVHNSRYNPRPVDRHYISGYRYMQRKWRRELPVQTCVVPITRSGLPLLKHLVRREIKLIRRGKIERSRHPDPAQLSKRLGYE